MSEFKGPDSRARQIEQAELETDRIVAVEYIDEFLKALERTHGQPYFMDSPTADQMHQGLEKIRSMLKKVVDPNSNRVGLASKINGDLGKILDKFKLGSKQMVGLQPREVQILQTNLKQARDIIKLA